jgi:hypothetical protein
MGGGGGGGADPSGMDAVRCIRVVIVTWSAGTGGRDGNRDGSDGGGPGGGGGGGSPVVMVVVVDRALGGGGGGGAARPTFSRSPGIMDMGCQSISFSFHTRLCVLISRAVARSFRACKWTLVRVAQ